MLTKNKKLAECAVAMSAITAAARHCNNDNGSPRAYSAQLCYDDALRAFTARDYEHAFLRALRSLRYSVGVLHPDYQEVLKGSGL